MSAPRWSCVLGRWRSPSGAAVAYAEAGIAVLPLYRPVRDVDRVRCSCGDAACASIGKHPIGRLVSHGVASASKDSEQVRRWWRAWREANVGIALGPVSGALALDIDPRNGGDVTIAALEAEHGALPPTIRARTGSGGAHILFRWPEGLERTVGKLGPGVDVKGRGGYVVAPPSVHASGGRYEWTTPGAEIADAPAWLLAALRPPAPPTMPAPPERVEVGDVEKRAVAYLSTLPPSVQGANGSGKLFHAAQVLTRGFLLADDYAVALLARHWNPTCCPPWSLRELTRAVARAQATGSMVPGALVHAEPEGRAA